MTAQLASLINAILLIALSAWGYLASDSPSVTALIPAAFGLVLIGCYGGVRDQNKVVAHVAVVLTLVVLLALVMPLRGAIGRADPAAITRVAVMMASSAFALVFFIRSFIAARRAREAEEAAAG
ncbi:MAG: hypothetical protein AAGC67_16635 [Myxococcota bacterium]